MHVSVSALCGSGARLATNLTPACPDRHGWLEEHGNFEVVSSPRWSLHDRAGFRPSFLPALMSRSLTFQFRVVPGILVEVFTVSSQDRVHRLLPRRIALLLRMRRLNCFFRTFPRLQKSAESDLQCGDDPAGGNFHN